jgi:hypothetical protein
VLAASVDTPIFRPGYGWPVDKEEDTLCDVSIIFPTSSISTIGECTSNYYAAADFPLYLK